MSVTLFFHDTQGWVQPVQPDFFAKAHEMRKNDIMRGYGFALFYCFRILQFCNGSLHSKFPERLHMAASLQ
jgi:hypothetical protein